MSFDDWLNNGFPVFSGDKNRSEARGMITRMGGPSGFKTAQVTRPDGSVVTVQLKGDMPPQITTTTKTVKQVGCRHGLYNNGDNSTGAFLSMEYAVNGSFAFSDSIQPRTSATVTPPINGDVKMFSGKYMICGANNRFCKNGTIVELGINSWLINDDTDRQVVFRPRNVGGGSTVELTVTVMASTTFANYGDSGLLDGASVSFDFPVTAGQDNLFHVCDVSSDGRKFLLSCSEAPDSTYYDALPEFPPDGEADFEADFDTAFAAGTITRGRQYETSARRALPMYEVIISGTYPNYSVTLRQLVVSGAAVVTSFTVPSEATFPVKESQIVRSTGVYTPLFAGSTPDAQATVFYLPTVLVYATSTTQKVIGMFYGEDDSVTPIYTVDAAENSVVPVPAPDYPFTTEQVTNRTVTVYIGDTGYGVFSGETRSPMVYELINNEVTGANLMVTTTTNASGVLLYKTSNRTMWGGGFLTSVTVVKEQIGIAFPTITSVTETHNTVEQPQSTFVTPNGLSAYSGANGAILGQYGVYKLHVSWHPTSGGVAYNFKKITCWV